MKTINDRLNELIGNIEIEDIEEFYDYYSSDYISDMISYYADSRVNIYYSDLREWLSRSVYSIDYMERAVDEYLVDTRDYDFYKHIQVAQYLYYADLCYNNIDEIKKYVFYKHIEVQGYGELNLEDSDSYINYSDNSMKITSSADDFISYYVDEEYI